MIIAAIGFSASSVASQETGGALVSDGATASAGVTSTAGQPTDVQPAAPACEERDIADFERRQESAQRKYRKLVGKKMRLGNDGRGDTLEDPCEARRAFAKRRAKSSEKRLRRARKNCWKRSSRTTIVKCFVLAATKKYRQPYADALRVAHCESTFNWRISGAYKGLYQFDNETWRDPRSPYRDKSVLSPKWASLAAMWFWKIGERSRWGCQ